MGHKRTGVGMSIGAAWALVVMIAVGTAVFAGCGGKKETPAQPPSESSAPASTEQAAKPAPAAPVTAPATDRRAMSEQAQRRRDREEAGTVTVKGAEGKESVTVEIAAPQLPDNFPKDFPLFKGAKSSVATVVDSAGLHFTVTMEISDAVAKVVDFYNKALPENGYDITATMAMAEGTMLHFKKGEKTTGVVTIAPDDGKATAAVVVTIEK